MGSITYLKPFSPFGYQIFLEPPCFTYQCWTKKLPVKTSLLGICSLWYTMISALCLYNNRKNQLNIEPQGQQPQENNTDKRRLSCCGPVEHCPYLSSKAFSFNLNIHADIPQAQMDLGALRKTIKINQSQQDRGVKTKIKPFISHFYLHEEKWPFHFVILTRWNSTCSDL